MINKEKDRQRKIYDSLGSKYAGYWEERFSDTDIIYLKDYENYREFKNLNLKSGDKVLDVGCNDATNLNRLAHKYGIKGFGVDISGVAIAYGKSKNIYNHVLQVSDAENLPFEDNFFDKIVSFDVFEHLPNPDLALAEIHRTLRPGGRALIYSISKKNKYSWHGFLRFISKNRIGVDTTGGHKQEMFILPEDFRKWSEVLNFPILKTNYFHAFFTLAYDEYVCPVVIRGIHFLEKQTSSDRIMPFYVKIAIPVIMEVLSFLDLPWKLIGQSNGFYALLSKKESLKR